MIRKFVIFAALAAALLVSSGCRHKIQNPLANIDSKQPDKMLYDRAMDSMKHGRYQESRTLLETLINTYPDSEFLARAKLAVGDAWYAEGGTVALQQAEVEFKDFQTFFPNLPEASEAQLKVANIHYRQMEKPDRDYSQAERAAEEYKTLIQTYPDSPLVPEARQRLREVQEILAERQFRIAHFYYLRENLAASQARLESLIDSFPLYSGIDEALYEMGSLYEKEGNAVKQQRVPEATKERMVEEFRKRAIEAYSRIITRYPAMDRAEDARKRLAALNAPIPTPTAEALAESKAEEESRGSDSMTQRVMGDFKKHPSVVKAARVGDPSMDDEKVASAPALVRSLQTAILQAAQPAPGSSQTSQKVGLETVGGGNGSSAPGPNQAPPGSGASSEGSPPPAAPTQVNEIRKSSDGAKAGDPGAQNGQQNSGNNQDSSSKKKGKKGLRKLIPF